MPIVSRSIRGIDERALPSVCVSDDGTWLALGLRREFATTNEVQRSSVVISGWPQPGLTLRVDPLRCLPYRVDLCDALLLTRLTDIRPQRVAVPQNSLVFPIGFSPDSRLFAFAVARATRLELWYARCGSGKATRVADHLNGTSLHFGRAFAFWLNHRELLCRLVPRAHRRGAAGSAIADPRQWFASELAVVDVYSGAIDVALRPDLYDDVNPSPDGKYVLVSRFSSTPTSPTAVSRLVELFSLRGECSSVTLGPLAPPSSGGDIARGRSIKWNATEASTAGWVSTSTDGTDVLWTGRAPFSDPAVSRYESGGSCRAFAFTTEGELLAWEIRDHSLSVVRVSECGSSHTPLWTRRLTAQERGRSVIAPWSCTSDDWWPVWKRRAHHAAACQRGDALLIAGTYTSQCGTHAFADTFDLRDGRRTRMFESPPGEYCHVAECASVRDDHLIVTKESARTPPAWQMITMGSGRRYSIWPAHPAVGSRLHRVQKRVLTYKRDDGVALSAVIQFGEAKSAPLPTVVWIYPELIERAEYVAHVPNANRYGCYEGEGPSVIHIVERGYAVVLYPSMPVFIDEDVTAAGFARQLSANATALLNALVEAGLSDPRRVAIGGFCQGATAAATLLVHTKLFCAGLLSRYYNTLGHIRMFERHSAFSPGRELALPLLLTCGEEDIESREESAYLAREVAKRGGEVKIVTLATEGPDCWGRRGMVTIASEFSTWCDRHVRGPAE